ncbi:MAG TPA: hypothetical protein VFS05_06535, partial [Gemmatimonadaceae bacterium]|nr:hypothetical protein [Gemmatimonadaceae bacterium]
MHPAPLRSAAAAALACALLAGGAASVAAQESAGDTARAPGARGEPAPRPEIPRPSRLRLPLRRDSLRL